MTTLDHAAAADLLERYRRARESFDGDAWTALFTEHAEFHADPFEPALVGRNAIRAYLLDAAGREDQLEFTVERHWVIERTVFAAWHASYVQRSDRARIRLAGFLTMEIADDGLIAQFREWVHRREARPAG